MSRRMKWGGFITATTLVAASSVLAAAPASAAPGDASAAALRLDLGASILGLVNVNAVSDAAAVTGNDSESLTLVNIQGLVGANATAGAASSTTTTGATGSSAVTSITGADVDLLGINLVTAGTATAEAFCPVGAAPTSNVSLVDATVLGQAVSLSAGTPTVLTDVGLNIAGLLGLTADVTIEQVETTSATTAAGTALELSVSLGGSLAGLPLLDTNVGTVTLAEASCERPAVAVAAAAIAPDSGPTVGGQTAVITGSGFTPDTTVTIGGVPAAVTSIDPTGTSVTVITPPGAPGATTAVATSGGISASLPYTYFEAAVASFTPSQGSTAGGTRVVLTGQNLGTAAVVNFDGVAGSLVSVAADEIVVVTPAHAAGPVPVTIDLAGGGRITAPAVYTFVETAITAIQPTAGSELGGTTVLITGTGLATTTGVNFGGTPAVLGAIAADGTSVSVTTPAGVGSVPVTLDLAGGPTLAAPAPFLYLGADDRDIADIEPDSGSTLGGTTVVIDGEGLQDAVSVDFGGVPGTVLGVAPDGTSVTVTAPPHAAGAVPVALGFSGGEQLESAEPFTYVVSAVADLSPSAGDELGGTTVVLSGSGLEAATGVDFDGVPATVLDVAADGRSITVLTPSGTGTVPVTVTLAGGAQVTAATEFRYLAADDRAIDAFEPAQGSTLGGTILTVSGDGLHDTETVDFDGIPGTVLDVSDDGTSVTVSTPASPAGPATVTLGFGGGTSLDGPTPYLFVDTIAASFSPTAGSSAGGTEVVVSGTGLATTETVTFGGTAATILDVAADGTQVTVSTPAGTGSVAVVVGLAGGNLLTAPGSFDYLEAEDRSIDDVSPDFGPTDGDTEVTILGEGLHDVTGVEFNGIPGEIDLVSDDGTTIVVRTPAHPEGRARIHLVTDSGERLIAPDTHRYVEPSVDGLLPSEGSQAGGTEVTITGSDFDLADTVTFGGVPATVQSVSPDGTRLVVITPPGTGSVPVIVAFPGGMDVTAPQPFVYLAPGDRSIDGFLPGSGSVNGGTVVTIDGDGLGDATGVTFGGNPGELLSVSDDGTTIVVRTPAGVAGPAAVVVQLSGGVETIAAPAAFTYTAAVAPTVDTVSPAAGPVTGGTTVVIDGGGLRDVTEITFGGVPGQIVGIPTVGSVTVITPSGLIGLVDVAVTTPDGTATVVDGFEYLLSADSIVTSDAGTGALGGSGSPSGLASTGVQGGLTGAIGLFALILGAIIWRRASVRTSR